jgi:hypothetical protein
MNLWRHFQRRATTSVNGVHTVPLAGLVSVSQARPYEVIGFPIREPTNQPSLEHFYTESRILIAKARPI